MNKIKNLVFDLGGVIITLNQPQAIRRFEEIGLKDAASYLNAYTQEGIFGDMEAGKITDEDFRRELSIICGKELTYEQCEYAWLGYRGALPQRNIDALVKFRHEGYRLILLSNTNPFMMKWARSEDFSKDHHSINDYFDAMYLSYECKAMKPSAELFRKMLEGEGIRPEETLFVDDGPRNVEAAAKLGINIFCPVNGDDWTKKIYLYL